MKRFRFLKMLCMASVVCVAAIDPAAQTFNTIGSFDGAGKLPRVPGTGNGDGNLNRTFLAPNAQVGDTTNVLYSFCSQADCIDGVIPYADLIPDFKGSLYGAIKLGGAHGNGMVFQLRPPSGDSRTWIGTVLYNFCSVSNCADGSSPEPDLVLDSKGNFYGTTEGGGSGWGTVFKLSPLGDGTGVWTETTLYTFCAKSYCGDRDAPGATVDFDTKENLYGTHVDGGGNELGMIFEMTPPSGESGLWTYTVLHNSCALCSCANGGVLHEDLILDSKGNLYGTTCRPAPTGTTAQQHHF